MKNVHLLPTDRPSRLRIEDNGNFVFGMIQTSIQSKNDDFTNQHIYITSDASDEEIKVGDWVITPTNDIIQWAIVSKPIGKKIILTTHQYLIKDGVQAINDKFLEWFIANPSYEEVEVEKLKCTGQCWKFIESDYKKTCLSGCELKEYKIIIPQGEPKQETLEEAAEKLYLSHENNELLYGHSEDLQLAYKAGILDGAKWQAERMYSEEEVKQIIEATLIEYSDFVLADIPEWFKQFKKK